MIGTIIGDRYEILEEIGKGGMAYVYKARCVMLNRIVAIKVLKEEFEGDEEFLQRFNSEAQSAASLTHPNIVGIFDVGIYNGKHYIVMEYVEGITLKNYIIQNVNLQYEEALDIAYQIADALGAAHDKNIVHRDIKPHNILITEDKKIKVTDFGIARTGTGNTLSTSDDILGSVHYISPEQARGESVDIRSDLYSLGIVMYEMITGKVPFDAETPVAVAMMQIEETAAGISNVDSKMPDTVEQIIFKAMSKDPDLRYQNADDFKEDIAGVLNDYNYIIPDGYLYINKYTQKKNDDFLNDSEEQHVKPIKKSTKVTVSFLSVVTALLIVAAMVAVAKFGFTDIIESSFSQSAIKVPSLVGKTFEEAQKICGQKKINLVIKAEKDDPSKEAGIILSQDPLANNELKRGEKTVYVIVVKESEKDHILEDYTGSQYEKAKKELEKIGCKVNIIFEDSQKEDGIILRQSPDAESKIGKDTKITFYVSRKIDEEDSYISVPYVIGKTYSEAKQILENAGLTVGSVTGVTNPESTDIISSQSIPAGSKVAKNCAINLGIAVVEEEVSDEQDNSTTEDEENTNDESEETQADSGESSDPYSVTTDT